MSFPDQGRPAPLGLEAYLAPGPSSFTDLVALSTASLAAGDPTGIRTRATPPGVELMHGTTIVALICDGGVVIAGDRRATAGNMIAQRDTEKVFVIDGWSAVGIAGTLGIALEMVKLFTVELEHYEKTEGTTLSFDGKANKLAAMVRANLGAAMQGLVVVPLFAGVDTEAEDLRTAGRIMSYEAVGGPYPEKLGYHVIGSGSVFARGALKKRHRTDADVATTIRTAVEALYDAADDDTATGGPDATRRIYPIVVSITAAEGAVRRPEAEIAEVVAQVVAGRTENPGG